MATNKETTSERVKKLEKELAEAKRALEKEELREALYTTEQNLAIYLHDNMCTEDHNDRCGWFYFVHSGVHDWDGDKYAHQRWLKKARAVRKFSAENNVEISSALKLVKIMNEN